MPKCFDVELKLAIFAYTAGGQPTDSVITKDNHYGDVGCYCNDPVICPPDRTATNPAYPEEYFITSLSPDLNINWRWQHTNTLSCQRNADGSCCTCSSDHPFGFE